MSYAQFSNLSHSAPLHSVPAVTNLHIQSETLTVYKGVENRVYSPVQDGREPLYSNNGVSPMLSGRIDPFSTPLYNGRNKLFPPSSSSCPYY